MNVYHACFLLPGVLFQFGISSVQARPFTMVPGHAVELVTIGMSRSAVLRYGAPTATYHYFWNMTSGTASKRVSITEDEWDKNSNDPGADIIYVGDKVFQIEEASPLGDLPNGVCTGSPFVEVLRNSEGNLSLKSYGFSFHDRTGAFSGAHEGYFYDDQGHGVAYQLTTQDPTGSRMGIVHPDKNNPGTMDSIVIHRIGYAVIPPSHGASVTATKPDPELTLTNLYRLTRLHRKSSSKTMRTTINVRP